MFKQLFLAGAVCTASIANFNTAEAATVSVELMLLTDSSGSVDTTDYNLIRNGYAAAFEDATVQANILASLTGSIAVAVSFFGSSYSGLSSTAGWTLIDSVASANNFAATLRAMSRQGSGSTNLTAGITGAAGEFAGNGFDSLRQVIDVTGDGSESVNCSSGATVCLPLQNARDAALAGDVDTINALFVNDAPFFGNTGGETIDSIAYGNTNVIGGIGSFVTAAGSFLDFETAIRDKIIREITPPNMSDVPVPAAGWLLIAGLGGLGAMRRRKGKASA